MKQLLIKIKCFFGFHEKQILGVSKYRQSAGNFTLLTKKEIVKECVHCKAINIPEWYKVEYRLLHPPTNIHGFSDYWRPESFMNHTTEAKEFYKDAN